MTFKDSLIHDINEMESLLHRHRNIIAKLDQVGDGFMPSPVHVAEMAPTSLKQVVLEAIEELEVSRKAFKSKQLESLRKKLIRALAESG